MKPIVTIAERGISDNIDAEINRALEDHELIKVRISVPDRVIRKDIGEEICANHKAELVQRIGNIILIFRAAKKPNPRLSNLLRLL